MRQKKKHHLMDRRKFIRKTVTGCAVVCTGVMGFPSIVRAKTDLKVGYVPILDHLTLMVSHATDNDRFTRVNITPKMFRSWNSVTGALKAGKIDGAYLLSPNAMDIFQKGYNIKTVLVAHRNGSGITVGKNSGIFSPRDMKGRSIAIPARISPHTALLDQFLRNNGLALADVKTKVISPPNMLKALKIGRIDGFIVAEPFCSKAESLNIGKTLTLSKEILYNHICCVVVVRNEVLRGNPEGISEWVESLVKSGKQINRDKTDNGARHVAEIAAKYTPHKTRDVINGMLSPHDRITYNDLAPRLADYQQMLDISKKAGILDNINMEEFIDDRFFKNITS